MDSKSEVSAIVDIYSCHKSHRINGYDLDNDINEVCIEHVSFEREDKDDKKSDLVPVLYFFRMLGGVELDYHETRRLIAAFGPDTAYDWERKKIFLIKGDTEDSPIRIEVEQPERIRAVS